LTNKFVTHIMSYKFVIHIMSYKLCVFVLHMHRMSELLIGFIFLCNRNSGLGTLSNIFYWNEERLFY